ncbi:MAG: enoyl-CoA hydratase-related protein [Xanthomonadaceae bacterium]|jgi:enoyl-CoA hydratase|nr:enoyl-CoA hydratase-related protein [Xanthomonadaceae bacterium]
MAFRNLLTADAGTVRTITVNRPDKLNALNRETLSELKVAFGAARDDDGVRVVVLTGAGPKAFVAGADITEFAQASPADALAFSRHGQELMSAIERLGKPSIARINGFALGGGLELALACSLRIAADTAKLGLPEINLGILPGFGGTQRTLRLAGRAATLELALTGATITASRALELRLVNRVVPVDQLDAEVGALAAQFAASAPHALRAILDAVLIGGECGLDAGLEFESRAFAVCASTEDMREGTRAFMEKRKPQFAGR